MSGVNASESGALTLNPYYAQAGNAVSPLGNTGKASSPSQGNTNPTSRKLDATGLVKQMEDCFKTLFNIFESQSLQGDNPYVKYRTFLRVNGFRMKRYSLLYTDSLNFLTILTTKSNITDVRSLASSGLVPNDSDVIGEGKRRIKNDLSKFFKNEGELLLETQVKFKLSADDQKNSPCLSSFEKENYMTFTTAWVKMLATLALEVRNPEVQLDKAMRLEDRVSKEKDSNPGPQTESALKAATEKANSIASSTAYSNADVLREELVTYQKTYLKDMAADKDAKKVQSIRAKAAGAGVLLSTGGLAATRWQNWKQTSRALAKEEESDRAASKAQNIKGAYGVETGETNNMNANKLVNEYNRTEEQLIKLSKENKGLQSRLEAKNIDVNKLADVCNESKQKCKQSMSQAVEETERWLKAQKTQFDPTKKEFQKLDQELDDIGEYYDGVIKAQFMDVSLRPANTKSVVENYTTKDVQALQKIFAEEASEVSHGIGASSENVKFMSNYAKFQARLSKNPELQAKWIRKGGFVLDAEQQKALQNIGKEDSSARDAIGDVGSAIETKLKKQMGGEFKYDAKEVNADGSIKKFDAKSQLDKYKKHLQDSQRDTRKSIIEGTNKDKAFTEALGESSYDHLAKDAGKSLSGLSSTEVGDKFAMTVGDKSNQESVAALGEFEKTLPHLASPRRRSSRRKTRVSRKRNVSRGLWESTKAAAKSAENSASKGFSKVFAKVAASKPGQAIGRSYKKANRPQVCKDCLKLRCGKADPATTTLTIPKGWTKGTAINITLLSGRKIPVKPPDTMKVGQKLEVKIPPLPTTMLIPYKVWGDAQKKGEKVVKIPWHYGRTVSVPIPPNAPAGSELRYTPKEPTEDEWTEICLGKGGVCHSNCLQLSPACAKCLKKQHEEWMKDKIDPKTKKMLINPKTKQPWTCNKKNGCFQKLQAECANNLTTRVKGTAAINAEGEAVCPTDVLTTFNDWANIAQAPELVGMVAGVVDWAVAGCLEGICEAALV